MLHPQNPPNPETQSSQKIQVEPKFEFEFVPRDTETPGFLVLVDSIWWGVTISVVTVIECVSVACLVECISIARISIAFLLHIQGGHNPEDALSL